ncbi:MAG: hypothetical protein IJ812_00855 [Schwartzia sp.]|nr:hypothetical protein [Schwartzia sp. (in: firmicutes)]
MKFGEAKGCACLFCGGNDRVQIMARDDGAAAFAVCSLCRDKMISAWSTGAFVQASGDEARTEQTYSDNAKHVMAEAAGLTEEQFEENYLSDLVDRVIFEYVRGYGKTALDGSAMGLLSIMTEQGAEVVESHIAGLVAKGLIYPVAGKPDCYGADYPFAED